jgi:DNA-binding transcriptional ArsR family regulator
MIEKALMPIHGNVVEAVGMPQGKEEIYSIMFSSLKHPARRKILRILVDKPLTFSEMLELLGISSSNLTYHLENLGELVSKDESGVYRLSTFGQAAVGTMKIVEEAPEVQPKKRNVSLKWRTATGILLIGLILFASMYTLQFNALNQAASERDVWQAKYNQLLAWSTTTDNAITFLKDVVQLDTAKYQATLLSRTVEHRADLGGIVEEIMQYSLTSSNSKLDVIFRFRNNQLSWYQLRLVEGAPLYSQAQSHIALDAAKGIVDRFKVYEQEDSYLENMSRLLTLVNTDKNMEIKEGNLKLNATVSRDNAQILIMYTENGVDFSPKSLSLTFENRILKELINGWYLFTVGSTDVSISSDRAVELAKNALKGYTWSANGQTVSNFNIMPEPASVVFHPNTKNSLTLYPQWTVTFYLDKIYAGDVYRISVEVWADTGGIGRIEPQNS